MTSTTTDARFAMPGMIQRAHGRTTTNTRPPTPHPSHDVNDFHTHAHKGTSCAFYNASGELSRYGLACGYVERRQLAPDFAVTLHREHNTYHVRTSTYLHNNLDTGCCVWQVFDTLTPARTFYHKLIKKYQAQ